jgi:hypothetical protein
MRKGPASVFEKWIVSVVRYENCLGGVMDNKLAFRV